MVWCGVLAPPSLPQVYENYGQPSHTYQLYHGFVLPPGNNTHDCLDVLVSLSPQDPGFANQSWLADMMDLHLIRR